MKTALCTR